MIHDTVPSMRFEDDDQSHFKNQNFNEGCLKNRIISSGQVSNNNLAWFPGSGGTVVRV